jgi:PadR family transcriptional regulator PadR
MRKSSLGDFERLILMAVLRLRPKAYGVNIREEISGRCGREVAIGAVYTTLERLQNKGFVSSIRGESTPERGGKAKRYFDIEAPGQRALNDSLSQVSRMSTGLRVPEAI